MASNRSTGPVELRVLDGPNLYFTRPAIKLTLDVSTWLALTADRATAVAAMVGVPPRPGPADPGTDARRRFILRVAGQLARDLASAIGAHLAVRTRIGPHPDQIVIAYPWRRRTAAEAFGTELAGLVWALPHTRRPLERLITQAADRVAASPPGPAPVVPDPRIPVVAVTGTNGKTTTVRLLAFMAQTAGLRVAYSSTDGVYVDGELVEAGDYSGFGGAARALSQPGVQMAVLESARGGILLRGIGTLHNDVAVVTNVSADHLGLHGIRTLDQLAEVKATITRITRSQGWDILNADDPRVLAMRRGARGTPWLLSLDHDHPAIRSALDEGGRATTIIDGRMTILGPGRRAQDVVPLEDVPVTLAGISRHNIQNAMAAASAAIAVGLDHQAVVHGLRTFILDEETNPGRANLYELEGRVVVLDYAHNEEGMKGMVEICRGLCRPGAEVWLAFSTAGDRSDEILHDLGYTAGRGADHVAVAELLHYLRGRDRSDITDRLRAGAIDGGAPDVPVFPDVRHALAGLLREARAGDVVGVTALEQRPELFADLRALGASRVRPARVRQLVRRARGQGQVG